MSIDKNSPYHLWHLFSSSEASRKMSTFLRGGLWCAELRSIVTFAGDVEGSQPYGVFVSCWHRSDGDPSARAWDVFADRRNGFALRARPSVLRAVADQFSGDGICARFDEVRYLASGQQVTDVAFQVAHSHCQEDEMRVALVLTGLSDRDTSARKEHIRAIAPATSSNPQSVADFRHLTFVEDDQGDAIILPISTAEVVEEILIGAAVSQSSRNTLLKMLEGSGLASRVRLASAI